MAICIEQAPEELMFRLKGVNTPLAGRCFENCVIAVLGLSKKTHYQYVLGLLTPPGYGPHPHAWLLDERIGGPVYLDPTLQDGSPLWRTRAKEFIYDERYRFAKDDLAAWFRSKYADREFDDVGVPKGLARGPVITPDGLLD